MKNGRYKYYGVLAAALGAAAFFRAQAVVIEPESKLWLIGDSTLHAYSSVATEMNVTADVEPGKPVYSEIADGRMKALEVKVPVKGLKSGKGGLDKNLWKALKADEHPDILFHMTHYAVSESTTPAVFLIKANGTLTIAGKTNAIELDSILSGPQNARIDGSEELLMSDYGIKPPSFMGAIRAHDRVVVNYHLVLSPSTQGPDGK